MKQKLPNGTTSKTTKVRFSLKAPETDRASLAGDLNGCVLVIPQFSRINNHTAVYEGTLSAHHLRG